MPETPDNLGDRIRQAQEKQSLVSPKAAPASETSATAKAMRAGIELVSAIAVGGVLGYGLDQWLKWTPWGMIVFIMLGFVAGFVNLYRAQTGQDYKIGFKETDKKE